MPKMETIVIKRVEANLLLALAPELLDGGFNLLLLKINQLQM
jgi:hypothetical protein